jgi:hypothetical protein
MYNVKGKSVAFDVMTLDEAMHTAKIMNEFVTITGPDFEVCGMFGVDRIKARLRLEPQKAVRIANYLLKI